MPKTAIHFQLDKIQPKEVKLIASILQNGGIGVLPTDTIYGLIGSALNKEVVDKIYLLRNRTPTKPVIILISSIKDLNLFNIKLDSFSKQFLTDNWPNPVSVILPCLGEQFKYLHRGTKTLAFRNPKNKLLNELMGLTGPLIAPSANFEGENPAETILEAEKYFDNNISFYIDNGKIINNPSTLVTLQDSKISVLRTGVYNIKT